MRGERKGTCNADLESAQQASSLLFKECVAYIGKFSSFSHRNSCNHCEVAASPKNNKSSEYHEEIHVNVKNLHLSQICLILSLYTTVITYKDLGLFSILEGGES